MNSIFNNRNLFLINLLFLLAFISCERKCAYIGNKINTIQLTDIAHAERCSVNIEKEVFLETNEHGLISYPTKIIDHDGALFVLTNINNGSIVIFNKSDGKFIRTINHVGKGPQEYHSIMDFTIDRRNNNILILDDNRCVLVYSFDDVFISTIKFKDMQATDLRHLAVYKNRILIEGMDRKYNSMFIFKENGKLEQAQLKAPYITAFLSNPFTFYGDSIFFHKKCCDTIYCWKDDCFRPYIFLNFGRYQLNSKEIIKFQEEHPGQLSNVFSGPKYGMYTFYETNGFYYFDLNLININISKFNYFHCFVDKKDNIPLCIEHKDLFKGILGHGVQFIGLSEDKNYLISYLLPAELYEYRDEIFSQYGQKKMNKDYPELVQLCQKTRIDDNPIVLFINLKRKYHEKEN